MHIRRICRRCRPERIFTSPERISIVIAEREGGSGGVRTLAKFAVPINGRFSSGEGVSAVFMFAKVKQSDEDVTSIDASIYGEKICV